MRLFMENFKKYPEEKCFSCVNQNFLLRQELKKKQFLTHELFSFVNSAA